MIGDKCFGRIYRKLIDNYYVQVDAREQLACIFQRLDELASKTAQIDWPRFRQVPPSIPKGTKYYQI